MSILNTKAMGDIDQRNKAKALINQQGLENMVQMFVDMYSTPSDFSDAPHRLGTPIAVIPSMQIADASTFPPFTKVVAEENLPIRVGGQKAMTEKINRLQSIDRRLTGRVYTELTEWDVSLYIQNNLMNPLHAPDFNICFNLFKDGRKRTKTQTLQKAMMNASMTRYRNYKWYPQLNGSSETKYWTAPSTSLNMHRMFGLKKSKARFPMTGQIASDMARARQAGWTSWYPKFWQLWYFHPQGQLTSADEDRIYNDSANTGSDDDKKWTKFFGKKGKKQAAAGKAYTADKFKKTAQEIGLNMNSPVLTGGPYGKYRDPRTFAGYLENAFESITPRYAPRTTGFKTLVDRYLRFHPDVLIDKLNNGWSITSKKKVLVKVLCPVKKRSDDDSDDRD